MIRVFALLSWYSARNRVLRQLRHIRRPRYLVACLLGGMYLWTMLAHQRPTPVGATADAGLVELVAASFLAATVVWAWLFGVERRVLAFSPAEVTFLFSAPVTRRDLIRYKLLRTQLLILFNTLLWTLILSYDRFGLSTWLRAAGIWMVLTTLSFHRLGASFVRTSLAEHGRFGARHRIASLLVVGAVLIAVTWSIADVLPALHDAWKAGVRPFLDAVRLAAGRPVPDTLLLPFRLMVRPLVADHLGPWLLAAGPAALLLILHYVWVIRSDAAFEEAAAAASLRRARQVATPRRGRAGADAHHDRIRTPFVLAPTGWPGGAILWKNLVAAARTRHMRHVALALIGGGALVTILSVSADPAIAGIAGWLGVTWAGALVVVGPQWIRNDLRGDLLKLDLLRSYPISGRTIVTAEIAASALVLTLVEFALLLFAYAALLGSGESEVGVGLRTAILLGALVCLPAVNFMGMLIQNSVAVIYPDWVHLGGNRPGGIETLGQNMLTIIAFVFLLSMTLLLPAGAGGAVFLLLEPAAGLWAAAPAIAVGLTVVATEAFFAVEWLGRLFDRTDPPGAGLSI